MEEIMAENCLGYLDLCNRKNRNGEVCVSYDDLNCAGVALVLTHCGPQPGI